MAVRNKLEPAQSGSRGSAHQSAVATCRLFGCAVGRELRSSLGSFSKAYGMAAASLLEAEIVTADGVVRTINARTNPDLFWGIKGGGGGSLGVVTRLTLRTRSLPKFFGRLYTTIQARSGLALGRSRSCGSDQEGNERDHRGSARRRLLCSGKRFLRGGVAGIVLGDELCEAARSVAAALPVIRRRISRGPAAIANPAGAAPKKLRRFLRQLIRKVAAKKSSEGEPKYSSSVG